MDPGTGGIDAAKATALRQVWAGVPDPALAAHTSPQPTPELPPVCLTLDVAGLTHEILLDGRAFVTGYAPIMRVIVAAQRAADRRILVGLAGVPGGGKSTFVATLAALWHAIDPGPRLSVIGMDGWHLTTAELDAREIPGPDGSPIPLRRRKGSPSSFDVDRLARDLAGLKAAGGDVAVPVYDRRLHEPRPDGLIVPADADVVLVEGNYLLLADGPWARVSDPFDLTFWLDIDPAACREDIIQRHITGGMDRAQAEAKYAENDRPNSDIARAARSRADWVIALDDRRRPRRLRRGPF